MSARASLTAATSRRGLIPWLLLCTLLIIALPFHHHQHTVAAVAVPAPAALPAPQTADTPSSCSFRAAAPGVTALTTYSLRESEGWSSTCAALRQGVAAACGKTGAAAQWQVWCIVRGGHVRVEYTPATEADKNCGAATIKALSPASTASVPLC